jgi:hypothetical protein
MPEEVQMDVVPAHRQVGIGFRLPVCPGKAKGRVERQHVID